MPIAYHLVFGCYGFWLPNDPRGSWSKFIGNRHLLRFGDATKLSTARSVARSPHNTANRLAAKQALTYPPVRLSDEQSRTTGRGFAEAISESRYRAHACCVMPDHVHFVVSYHEREPKRIVGHFKGRATQHLKREGLYPPPGRRGPLSPWARGGWCVYLDEDEDVRRAVEYVDENPGREGLPPQRWEFVVPP